MSEIIELTETARLLVEQDADAENPRKDWDMATGFVKIGDRGDSRLARVPAVHRFDRLSEAYYRLLDTAGIYFTDVLFRAYVRAEAQTARWARIFYGLHVEYDHEHGGFWFVAPEQIKVNNEHGGDWSSLEKQAEVIASEQKTYRQWAEGEVYTVVLERVATFEKVTHHSDGTLEQVAGSEWEVVESIGGCYLDDDYTAQVVASEYFNLTTEETEALGLPERVRPEIPVIEATVSGEY
jgi:hypothetical protein